MRALLLAAALAVVPLSAVLAADAVEVVADPSSAAAKVAISKMKFQNPEVKVKVGDVVTWNNTEALPHNVHFKPGGAVAKDVEGPMLRANETFSVKFNQAGTYDYICTPHPFMKGKVVVE